MKELEKGGERKRDGPRLGKTKPLHFSAGQSPGAEE